MAQFAMLNQSLGSAVDQTANPPWCMIPAQGSKVVRLVQGDGLALRFLPGASGGIQFTERTATDGRRIELKALGAGEATLQAMSGQTVAASLDLSVFPHKEFKISIRFVYDKSGEVSGRGLSRLSYSEMQAKISAMNNIFLPQLNLGVRILSMGPTHVPDDLSQGFLFRAGGIAKAELETLPAALHVFRSETFAEIGCVSGRRPGPDGCDPAGLETLSDPNLRNRLRALDQEFDLFGRTDHNADFTFLLINRMAQAPDVGAYSKADGCILPDTIPPFARAFVMAHEFGHFLLVRRLDGRAWHTSDPQDLMSPTLATLPSNVGFRIRKAEALQMAKKNPK